MSEARLNRRQLKFIDNIMEGMLPWEAYAEAGYKPRSENEARSRAYKLMTDERVKAGIVRREEEMEKELQIKWRELVKMAKEKLKEGNLSKIQREAASYVVRKAASREQGDEE